MTRELRAGPNTSEQILRGTPKFGPGARLYLGEVYWGTGESAHMIGLRRGSKDYINCVVRLALLTDVRVKLVYSPGIWEALLRLNAQLFKSREEAEEVQAMVARTIEYQLRRASPVEDVTR